MISSIMSGSLIRATPPWARMSAGTRSSAITATAPASSAIFAWSARDHVHDHPALEHLGHAALDPRGPGRGGAAVAALAMLAALLTDTINLIRLVRRAHPMVGASATPAARSAAPVVRQPSPGASPRW